MYLNFQLINETVIHLIDNGVLLQISNWNVEKNVGLDKYKNRKTTSDHMNIQAETKFLEIINSNIKKQDKKTNLFEQESKFNYHSKELPLTQYIIANKILRK